MFYIGSLIDKVICVFPKLIITDTIMFESIQAFLWTHDCCLA